MLDRILAFLLNESRWLAMSMGAATVLATTRLVRRGRRDSTARHETLVAMNLFHGATIGVMACGHVFAVSVRGLQGTLEGPLVPLLLLGVALAVPSWWLLFEVRHADADPDGFVKRVVRLDAFLLVALLATGPRNAPLALPALLNIGYALHSRRAVGFALVAASALVQGLLLVGSLVFFASGRSFEEFSGM